MDANFLSVACVAGFITFSIFTLVIYIVIRRMSEAADATMKHLGHRK